jgi:hypothetical protein
MQVRVSFWQHNRIDGDTLKPAPPTDPGNRVGAHVNSMGYGKRESGCYNRQSAAKILSAVHTDNVHRLSGCGHGRDRALDIVGPLGKPRE